MNLKKTVMQYARKGKQWVDQGLVALNGIVNSKQLEQLQRGEYYGFRGDLATVDQLGGPQPELVEAYYGKINDPEAAARFGTANLDEYSHWSWRSCGVANVATLLRTAHLFDAPLYQLVSDIRNAGGYLSANRWGDSDIGWKHDALRDALVSRGVQAELSTRLSVEGLLAAVAKGAAVIASVKSRLSDGGSHMVIVYGFQWDGENTTLNVYDPYTLDGKGGVKTATLPEFTDNFLNRGIVTWLQTSTTEA